MSNSKILIIGGICTLAFAAYLFFPKEQQQELAEAQQAPAPVGNLIHNADNADAIQVTMFKNPSCGCCTKWAEHMVSDDEFAVEEIPTTRMNDLKADIGVPRTLSSCHTAKIGGYIVEGHVPKADIKRLLDEKPDAIGLTVPGMPTGSPGMEIEGRPADNYDVLLIKKDGSTEVFSSY